MSLPFPVATADKCSGGERLDCPLSTSLPPELWQACRESPHLHRYVHGLPIGEVGVPTFCNEPLSPKLSDLADRNLIYPFGEQLFVHIYGDEEDVRDVYILVDPSFACNIDGFLEQVERYLIGLTERLAPLQSVQERVAFLEEALQQFQPCSSGGHGRNWLPFRPAGQKVLLSREEFTALKYVLTRDRVGLGILEPYLRDPYIEDISCSGVGPLFIEHRVFGPLKTAFEFTESKELDEFAQRLAAQVNKPVTYRNPVSDATLPDGSRINIVYGDVSRRGSNFSVRKFTPTPLSILDLVDSGTLDYRLAAYLSLVVGEGLNLFICGESASGKTALLNAIGTFIPGQAKIVTLEDTPEVQLPHPNWTRELVREIPEESEGANVTMFSLLKTALRQRPNAILIGEIRGEEGAIAFQAMQTGHAVMATFHASDLEKLVQRLTGSPISVPLLYVDNLNVVVFVSAVRLPTGKSGRRIIQVSEIVGYDASIDAFDFGDAFLWDALRDEFEFAGHMNSYILEEKIAPRLALTRIRSEIYGELDRRAALLARIHQSGVTNFYDLHNLLATANWAEEQE